MTLVVIFAGSSAVADTVRIRLGENYERLLIQGRNIKVKNHFKCEGFCSFELLQKSPRQVLIKKVDGSYFKSIRTKVQISGDQLRLGSKLIPNKVDVLPEKGGMTLIAFEDLEHYLIGVLASEMPTNWPLETLKAQAVAAKSYLKAVQQERVKQSFDVEATVLDQVFKKRDISSEQYSKVVKAVRSVSSYKLINQSGEVLKAFYHADCGGQTLTPTDVWAGGESFGTARDQTCATRKKSRWNFSLSKEEFFTKIARKLKLEFAVLPEIAWGQKEIASHREVVFYVGEQQFSVAGNQLRSWLGFDRLKSTRFRVVDHGDRFEFEGIGYGHGVGLCQWGSRDLGQKGYSFQRILKHYYPLAQIKSLR
ncbi:MAG: SpoIID/LytB domain-containing protein [Bdellovibrionia bacterium]